MTTPAVSHYRRIEGWLRDRVMMGHEGDALPSEAELAEQFGVSRMTARQAVQNVAADGLVRRVRGAGTFIAARPVHRHSGPLMSFTDDMRRRGLAPSSRILDIEFARATSAEAAALRLAPEERVVRINRLRFADGEPMAIEDAALTPDCVSVMTHDLESGSLHQALRNLGRTPTTAECRISARPATTAESDLLAQPRRSPVLVEQRLVTDQRGLPVEATTTVYRAERYVIDARFSLIDANSTADPGRDPR